MRARWIQKGIEMLQRSTAFASWRPFSSHRFVATPTRGALLLPHTQSSFKLYFFKEIFKIEMSSIIDTAYSAASLIRFVIVVLGGACIAVQLIPSQLNGSVSPRGALSAAAVTATRTTVHAPPRATQPPPIVEKCGSITEGSAAENTTLAYRGAPAWCTCMKLRVGPWRMPSGEGGLTNKMMRVGTSSLETIAKQEVALLPRHRNCPLCRERVMPDWARSPLVRV